MGKKREALRKIDQKTTNTGAPLPLIQEDQPAPPAFYLIPAPDTLVLLGQAILRSTQAPLVAVALSWQEAPNIAPDYYNVEWSESSSFTDVQRKRASTTSATIDGLKANGVTYYFRVQAVLGGIYSPFSETLTVVTMTDTTPAPIVTGASAVFINGDLFISWTNPASEIFKDVEIKIYNAAHTILYATLHTAAQQITWTANDNLNASGNVGITSVSIDIFSRSWGNTLSAAVNTTATSTAPSTPNPTFSWTGDTGLASADLLVTWSKLVDADSYDLVFDGVPYKTANISYLYRYEQNVNNHRPTLPSGDASITITLGARNKLNQVSTLASGTATNVAPPSGVMSLQVTPGFSMIAATVSLLANTIIQDFDHYEWALTSGSSTVQSFISQDTSVKFLLSGSGTYGVSVKAVDKFNQKSVATTSSGIVMDVLTISQLRAETTYRDSLGATSPTLDFYKDGTGNPSGTNKIYSAIASGTYNWIEAQRPLLDRYKVVTFDAVYAGATLSYLSFDDGTTTTYYAGPITIGSAGQSILTKYTTEANAKTNRFRIDLLGTTRIDLPNIQEARTVRIYFSNYIGNLTAYEYYPRRLVQTDDLEAENARAITAVVGTLAADKLSALVAYIGQLNIDATGYLYQGTGTGSSPTTGLKIFNSGGIGKLSTYNTGVEQITLDTDGKFKAGGGSVILDANGIQLNAPASATYDTTTAIDWYDGSSNRGASIRGYVSGGFNTIALDTVAVAGHTGQVTALADGTRPASFALQGASSNSIMYLTGDRIELRSPKNTYTGAEGIWFFADPSSSTPDMLLTSSGFFSNVTAALSQTTVGLGSAVAGTRALNIQGDNEYLAWQNAAGTEKWVAGLETAGSGRWILYSAANGIYGITLSAAGLFTVVNNILANGSLATNVIKSLENTTTGITMSMFSGEPGQAFTNGVLGYNYTPLSGSSTGREQNTGGGYIRFTTGSALELHTITSAGADNFALGIGSAGNVGVANKLMVGSTGTAPTHTLQLINDDAAKTTTTTWATTSTKQAKDNIQTRNGALDRISKLRLTNYETNGKYNTIKGAKGVGFIAEELINVYPNAVNKMTYQREDGTEESYLASNPHEIFMDYAPAIQELLARIEALEKK